MPQAPAEHAIERRTPVFLRMRTVLSMTGLARSTIYRLISRSEFPAPVRLSQRTIAWRLDDVEQWSADRPAIGR